MQGPDGRDDENKITFDEIVEPERIVYHYGGGDDVEPVRFSMIVSLKDLTRITLRAVFPSAAERVRVIKQYGAGKGMVQTLDRPAGHLATLTRSKEQTVTGQSKQFVFTRTLDAPRDLVWKAWSEADRLAQWWGPKGCKLIVGSLDFRPGGIFHYGMQWQTGKTMWGRFVYREMMPPERLVFVNSFSDENQAITRAPFDENWPREVLNVVTFEDLGGKTKVTLRGGPIDPTDAERALFEGHFASMEQGFGGTFEQLAAYLAKS